MKSYEELLQERINETMGLTNILLKIPQFVEIMSEYSFEQIGEKWVYENYIGSKRTIIDATHHQGKMTVDSFIGKDQLLHIWFDDGNMRLELSFDNMYGFNVFDKYLLFGFLKNKESLALFVDSMNKYLERR